MQTTGNTILITGGTSGLGLAFAEEFLKRGNKVIICGRRKDRLGALQKTHPGLAAIECDIADEKQREMLAEKVIREFPGVNMLMNNAGVQLAVDLTSPVKAERIRAEIETNLVAPIHLATLFVKHLASQSNPAILTVSSGLAFCPIAFMPIYCATKAAIHSYCLSLRYQMRNTPVKIFEIIPPSVDTELGHERRTDKTQTHGGMPVAAFLSEAMEAIENDLLEAPVADAKGLRSKGEAMFPVMNR
ncbi:MAG TPA: SDR family NAD(P)-dependent oxidoreductase [Bacteroidia bacterium]|nr:SDR family NAD(P)-dependent oxidoreductase [Bacteroidia bacterium]